MRVVYAGALVAALAVAGCGGDAGTEPQCTLVAPSYSLTITAPVTSKPTRFDIMFEQAAAEFGVSASTLKSIAYVETRWQMVQGREEFAGQPAAFGVMALRGGRLEQGAALAGVSVETAKSDALANIRAAAALLAVRGLDDFSSIELPEARTAYTREVRAGLGQPVAPAAASAFADKCTTPPPPPAVDFASAIWRASPNFNARATGSVTHMVIIHTCEGNYSGCWGWLVNTASQVSAHYVVNETGSEVSQLVREKDRAWQIAAYYDCALNAQHDCGLNGVQMNHVSIGIEHAGFAAQDSFPTSQLEKSAQLVCDMSKRWNIPRDSLHIVAHGQLQPANRTDPGPHWPWHRYIGMIRSYCGDT